MVYTPNEPTLGEDRTALRPTDQSMPQLPQEALAVRSQFAKLPEMSGGGDGVFGIRKAVCMESRGGEQGQNDGQGLRKQGWERRHSGQRWGDRGATFGLGS